MEISSLPVEIKEEILLKVDPASFLSLILTSSEYRDILEERSFWLERFFRDFGPSVIIPEEMTSGFLRLYRKTLEIKEEVDNLVEEIGESSIRIHSFSEVVVPGGLDIFDIPEIPRQVTEYYFSLQNEIDSIISKIFKIENFIAANPNVYYGDEKGWNVNDFQSVDVKLKRGKISFSSCRSSPGKEGRVKSSPLCIDEIQSFPLSYNSFYTIIFRLVERGIELE